MPEETSSVSRLWQYIFLEQFLLWAFHSWPLDLKNLFVGYYLLDYEAYGYGDYAWSLVYHLFITLQKKAEALHKYLWGVKKEGRRKEVFMKDPSTEQRSCRPHHLRPSPKKTSWKASHLDYIVVHYSLSSDVENCTCPQYLLPSSQTQGTLDHQKYIARKWDLGSRKEGISRLEQERKLRGQKPD